MQSLLTLTAEAIAVFTVGYTVIAFALYAWERSAPATVAPAPPAPSATPASPPSQTTTTKPQPSPALLPDPWELPTHPRTDVLATRLFPIPALLLLPPAKPAPALPDTIRELRQLCKQQGIKGSGRWTKAQCLAALALEPIGVSAVETPIRRRRRKAQTAA